MVRSIFASIVTVIFTLFFVLSFVLFVLLNTVLNPDFYKGALAEQIYETSVDVLGGAIYKSEASERLFFTEDELKKAFRDVLSPADFEGMLVPFVEQLVDPVFDESGTASVTLDLSSVLDKLPEFGAELAVKLYSTAPDCGESVAPDELCVPKGVSVEDFKRDILEILDKEFLSSIPTKLITFELHEQDLQLFPGTSLSKDLLWKVWWMFFAVQALLLLIIALIILKPLGRVLCWVSKPLLSGSIFVSVLFLVLYKLPDLFTNVVDPAKLELLTEKEIGSLIWFVKGFLWVIASKALMYAGFVFVVGLIIYISGLWLKHHSHE